MARTLTAGGAMSGYCSTGSAEMRADAGQHDDDGDDPGEDRPVDEDARDHDRPRFRADCLRLHGRLDAASNPAGTGTTASPPRIRSQALDDDLVAGLQAAW